jgi:hypothetical protein
MNMVQALKALQNPGFMEDKAPILMSTKTWLRSLAKTDSTFRKVLVNEVKMFSAEG